MFRLTGFAQITSRCCLDLRLGETRVRDTTMPGMIIATESVVSQYSTWNSLEHTKSYPFGQSSNLWFQGAKRRPKLLQ